MTKRKGELHGTGHTKFSPDACFGIVKRKFRRTDVSSLDDLARVVNESATCNLCQLVGTQNGTTIMPSCNWAGFLSPHFAAWTVSRSTVTSALSRTILKKTTTMEEETRCLLWGVWSPLLEDNPPLVPATGLSLEQRRYPLRGYENTAARRVKMPCALTLLC